MTDQVTTVLQGVHAIVDGVNSHWHGLSDPDKARLVQMYEDLGALMEFHFERLSLLLDNELAEQMDMEEQD